MVISRYFIQLNAIKSPDISGPQHYMWVQMLMLLLMIMMADGHDDHDDGHSDSDDNLGSRHLNNTCEYRSLGIVLFFCVLGNC